MRHCSIICRGGIGPSWIFWLLEMMGSKCAFFFDILTPEGDRLLFQNRIWLPGDTASYSGTRNPCLFVWFPDFKLSAFGLEMWFLLHNFSPFLFSFRWWRQLWKFMKPRICSLSCTVTTQQRLCVFPHYILELLWSKKYFEQKYCTEISGLPSRMWCTV